MNSFGISFFKTKTAPVSGSNMAEVTKKVMRLFHDIEKRTKRRPYIRCKIMNNDKVFIGEYIMHQNQKTGRDRLRRLKLFPCAVELIERTTYPPTKKILRSGEILYRFYGDAENNQRFVVQISENPKTHNKRLMSSFPYDG
jgi:hypothetical protein